VLFRSRLEARGENRGGRFVSSVAGEQYALPEIIPLLRSAASESSEKPLILPATDPLNFTGRIGSSPRVPALPGYSIAITQGDLKTTESAKEHYLTNESPSSNAMVT